MSLTWILRPFGMIPLYIHHDSRVRSQWGRYNLPRYMMIIPYMKWKITNVWNHQAVTISYPPLISYHGAQGTSRSSAVAVSLEVPRRRWPRAAKRRRWTSARDAHLTAKRRRRFNHLKTHQKRGNHSDLIWIIWLLYDFIQVLSDDLSSFIMIYINFSVRSFCGLVGDYIFLTLTYMSRLDSENNVGPAVFVQSVAPTGWPCHSACRNVLGEPGVFFEWEHHLYM